MTIVLSPQRAAPGEWDTLVLDDMTFPGTAKVTFSRGRKIERKKIPGKNGEDLDIKGVESGDIDITVRVWTKADYDTVVGHIKAIDPTPGTKQPKIYSVTHAVPNSRGVGYLVVEKVDGPEQSDQYTEWKIKAYERLKPNNNNVGLGGPAGQTCDQLRQEYEFRRNDYLQTKAKAQPIVADLRSQQLEGIGTDEARALQIEQVIRQIENDIHLKLLKIRAVGDRMIQKGCPNVPPDVGGL